MPHNFSFSLPFPLMLRKSGQSAARCDNPIILLMKRYFFVADMGFGEGHFWPPKTKVQDQFSFDRFHKTMRVAYYFNRFLEKSREHFQHPNISGVGCRVWPSGGPDHRVRGVPGAFRWSSEHFPPGKTINQWNGLLSPRPTFPGIGEGELPNKDFGRKHDNS